MFTVPFNKQLLDEVEHDIVNYQNRGLCYLQKPKAEADNTDLGFDNSRYHAKTEFNNCFIIHFLNNLQTKTNSATFAKGGQHYTDEGLGN